MGRFYQSQSDRFYTLLSRKLGSTISAEEKAELEQLLITNPDLQLEADIFTGIWYQSNLASSSNEAREAYIRHFLKYKTEFLHDKDGVNPLTASAEDIFPETTYNGFHAGWKTFIVSGALVSVLILAFFLFPLKKPAVPKENTQISSVITKYGNRSKVSLPDGSQVWLNAGSRLDYREDAFRGLQREVSLTGEAYFDIVHESGRPFIVRSGNMKIRVLGTSFNVKAYPEEYQMETSLIRGSVEITIRDRPDDIYILRPNEKLVVTNDEYGKKAVDENPVPLNTGSRENGDIVSLKKVNYSDIEKLVVETAWVENKLVFRAEKFIDLSKKLERWYDIQIRFRDPEKESLKFTGIFTTETIQQALKAMQVVHRFQFVQENNIIYID